MYININMNSLKQQLYNLTYIQPKKKTVSHTFHIIPKCNTKTNKLYFASNSCKSHTLCRSGSHYISNNVYNDQHDYWAVYLAHKSCSLSDNNKFLYIEKCLNCYFSRPSLVAIKNYKELIQKSKLKEYLCFNDFYSVTKNFHINVLKHVSF